MRVFKCEACGKTLLTMVNSKCTPRCCGEVMTDLEPNVTDGALEKHVPAVTAEGNTYTVQVGEVQHPMLEAHYIQWIALETVKGVQVRYLNPGDTPSATFVLTDDDEAIAAYEYCNLHGFWKKAIAEKAAKGGKTLVAYFSASGVTEAAARRISELTGADLYAITPASLYTSADLDWTDSASRSTSEMNDPNARPELAAPVPALDEYDAIAVGYPIWWGVAPRIINTFLEQATLSGKTVIPFATSGGSPAAKSEAALREALPADVKVAPVLHYKKSTTDEEITAWIAGR